MSAKFLKIKVKTLAAEAKFIKREEREYDSSQWLEQVGL